jgi:2,4-diaminopentanoate dehydrogenase
MRVAVYGAGQAGTAIAALLRERRAGGLVGPSGRAERAREDRGGTRFDVLGPFGRGERALALRGGADVVVIATTSFLREIAGDLHAAIDAGSNVLTTAEEAAYPWATSPEIADEVDARARERGVTVLGAGLNPGLAFDALVLTVVGASAAVAPLRVQRVVDLSGFGSAVLRRIGVGHSPEAFAAGVASGEITGHIGFPQSMRLVAARLGVEVERIDRQIAPIVADREHVATHVTVAAGETAGFEQRYVAIAGGEPWFTALFTGHVDSTRPTRDAIQVASDPPIDLVISPGLNAQRGSAAVLANSVQRVVDAPPGWLTVADLPPAVPS